MLYRDEILLHFHAHAWAMLEDVVVAYRCDKKSHGMLCYRFDFLHCKGTAEDVLSKGTHPPDAVSQTRHSQLCSIDTKITVSGG